MKVLAYIDVDLGGKALHRRGRGCRVTGRFETRRAQDAVKKCLAVFGEVRSKVRLEVPWALLFSFRPPPEWEEIWSPVLTGPGAHR